MLCRFTAKKYCHPKLFHSLTVRHSHPMGKRGRMWAMAQKQKLAIFDVDGTIFRSSLLIQLVNKFIEKGAFPEDARKVYENEHRKWLDREGDYEEDIMGGGQAFRIPLKSA